MSTITVAQLIEQLKQCDPHRVVILSSDSEGNKYSPLCDTETGAYVPETNWNGEMRLEELTAEAIKAGYTEEDVAEDGVPALVLYPTN